MAASNQQGFWVRLNLNLSTLCCTVPENPVHLAEISAPTMVDELPLSWAFVVGDTGLEPMTSTV